jgi:hypothetical protein
VQTTRVNMARSSHVIMRGKVFENVTLHSCAPSSVFDIDGDGEDMGKRKKSSRKPMQSARRKEPLGESLFRSRLLSA